MSDSQKHDDTEPHVMGTMNIEAQERTFEAFLSIVGRGMAICVVALILLYLING